jgi:hypothetical protein
MGVKSEKTFEEIVERIVALFTPAPLATTPAPHPAAESSDELDPRRPYPIPDTSSDDNTR